MSYKELYSIERKKSETGCANSRRDTCDVIGRLFPACVSISVANQAMFCAPLQPEEMILVRAVSEVRRQEFTAGRNAARAALSRFGILGVPILRSAYRAPIWPSGYTGSISHCSQLICAVVAETSDLSSLGVDIETAESLETPLIPLVCRDDELRRLSLIQQPKGISWPKLIFSAKEAFYKCIHPLIGEVLDFSDVSIGFSIEDGRERGSCWIESIIISGSVTIPKMAGRWEVRGTHVFVGVFSPR